MLEQELPDCVCGTHDYEGGGGTFGGSLCTQGFTCLSCGRQLMVIDGYYMGPHAFFPRDEDTQLGEDVMEYINGPMMATWRTHEAIVNEREERFYVERRLSHTLVCEDNGLPVETSYYDFSKELRDRIDPLRNQLRQDAWSIDPPLLPRLPESAFVKAKSRVMGTWHDLTHDMCKDVDAPPDPIRVRHDKFWGDVLAQFASIVGVEKLAHDEMQNQYWPDKNRLEPWYTFTAGDLRFVVGPRKRVDVIRVERTDGGKLYTQPIKALTDADEVTYTADGGWKNSAGTAHKIEVHAYTREKLLEYFRVICALGRVS